MTKKTTKPTRLDRIDNIGHRFSVSVTDDSGTYIDFEVTVNAMGASRLRRETVAMEDSIKDELMLLLRARVNGFHVNLHQIKVRRLK